MADFSFREATEADLAQIVAMLRDDRLGQTREDSKDLSAYEKAFDAIESDPNHFILLALEDGGVVGCVQVSYLPNLTFTGAWRAQLEGVRVKSDRRGQGLGKQLIQEAIELAKARGCRMVQLTSNKSRPEAITFYETLGFEPTHIGMKLYF